jgi:hypothetical protein
MVIHYPPARLRRNSDQPTAITNVLVTTAGSTYHTGDIALGTPTCSARTRHGRWALYPSGDQVVVVWPGGALSGPPAEVAGALDRLGGDRHDEQDRGAALAIRQFLNDPAAADTAHWSSIRPARLPPPPVSQPARRTSTDPADAAARPQPAADPCTSRLRSDFRMSRLLVRALGADTDSCRLPRSRSDRRGGEHGRLGGHRRAVGTDQAAAAGGAAAAETSGSAAAGRPSLSERGTVCSGHRYALGSAPGSARVWVRGHVLAAAPGLDPGRRMGPAPRTAVGRAAWPWPDRLVPSRS